MGMGPGSSVSCDVAAILEDTENLPTDPADASDIAAQNAILAAQNVTIQGYTDTLEVTAVTIAGYTDTLEATAAIIVGYTDTLEASAAVLDAFHDVPDPDSIANAQMRDAIGNKDNDAKYVDIQFGIHGYPS